MEKKRYMLLYNKADMTYKWCETDGWRIKRYGKNLALLTDI